jgi:hypothetical protein
MRKSMEAAAVKCKWWTAGFGIYFRASYSWDAFTFNIFSWKFPVIIAGSLWKS